MDDKPKKSYITTLQEKVKAYEIAIDAMLAWAKAEERANNTAYRRDAENLADLAKKTAVDALAKAAELRR